MRHTISTGSGANWLTEADEFLGEVRMYSPATGPGNPLALPMTVTTIDDGVVLGHCILGTADEVSPVRGPYDEPRSISLVVWWSGGRGRPV